MPPSAISDHLASGDRSALERLLADFRAAWTEKALAARIAALPPDGPFRRAALREMVKIDLECHYGRGRRPRVEAYLQLYPELGTPQTVAVDLLHAEVQARRANGVAVDLDDYAQRFPQQAEALRVMASETVPPEPVSLGEPLALGTVGPPAVAPPREENRPFGKYVLLHKLGEGGMGEVWKARDTTLKRFVALKLPKVNDKNRDVLLRRFEREATAVASLSHARICTVHDYGDIDGQVYLAMEFVEGRSLAEVIKIFAAKGKPMPVECVVELVRRVAAALEYAHGKGVIHRDLKPANLMVKATDNDPVVMDFGLAKRLDSDDSRLTVTGLAMGTPAYMPPEQVLGEVDTIGPWSDVYSLGVILYELLTGRLPFLGGGMAAMAKALTDDPEPPSSLRPGLDRRLEAICLKAIAKRPGERHASMAVFRSVLTAYLQSFKDEKALPMVLPVAEGPPPPPRWVPSPRRPIAPPDRPAETHAERPPTKKKPPLAVLIAVAVVLSLGFCVLLMVLPGRTTSRGDPEKKAGAPVVQKGDPPPPQAKGGIVGVQGGGKGPPIPKKSFADEIGLTFVRVPKGTFWMSRNGVNAQVQETIADDFEMGVYEVTQAQWLAVMGGANPCYFSRNKKGAAKLTKDKLTDAYLAQFPVESVSWYDIQEFLKRLNENNRGSGWTYRLPTEAEWEYSCRGGALLKTECEFDFYIGRNPSNDLSSKNANFDGKHPAGKADRHIWLERTSKVCSYPPNKLGLYDMHGNVWEWTATSWGSDRVVRGGSWCDDGQRCAAAFRSRNAPESRYRSIGFRLVRSPSGL